MFAGRKCLGYAEYDPATMTKLTDAPTSGVALPTGADSALITVETQPIRWLDDGATAVTSSLGHKKAADNEIVIEASRARLRGFRMIETAGSAKVFVTYYG